MASTIFLLCNCQRPGHPVVNIEKTNNNTNKNNLFFIESTSFFSDRIIIPKNNNIKFLFNSLFFDNFIMKPKLRITKSK